ncbi:MAG: hypothetical protein IK000_09540 [Bacteroidaceae bacterium]|nr:hypothetical protein [Bacteroidaceae bacterium]
MKVNTELCVDLKTKLQNDVLMKVGKDYPGILRRDMPSEDFDYEECHYTFIETVPPAPEKRNPRVFNGTYITLTRRSDGTLRPNFKPLKAGKGFSIEVYARGVADELRKALSGLIEKK